MRLARLAAVLAAVCLAMPAHAAVDCTQIRPTLERAMQELKDMQTYLGTIKSDLGASCDYSRKFAIPKTTALIRTVGTFAAQCGASPDHAKVVTLRDKLVPLDAQLRGATNDTCAFGKIP